MYSPNTVRIYVGGVCVGKRETDDSHYAHDVVSAAKSCLDHAYIEIAWWSGSAGGEFTGEQFGEGNDKPVF